MTRSRIIDNRDVLAFVRATTRRGEAWTKNQIADAMNVFPSTIDVALRQLIARQEVDYKYRQDGYSRKKIYVACDTLDWSAD